MKLIINGVIGCLMLAVAGFGQTDTAFKERLAKGIGYPVYPPLARAARVSGDVTISMGTDGSHVASGTQLLSQSALESVGQASIVSGPSPAIIVFHFILVDPIFEDELITIPRGNKVGRFFLRMIRANTTKTITVSGCRDNPHRPDNRADVTRSPIEVWVYGSTMCVQTESTLIASR